MKRVVLVRHLLREGCTQVREGARHSVFCNIVTNRISTVPRHTEINNILVKKICHDLGVKEVAKK